MHGHVAIALQIFHGLLTRLQGGDLGLQRRNFLDLGLELLDLAVCK
jgi:hypothetical protein